jgi:DNA-binding CsgD family transcriptional regulator
MTDSEYDISERATELESRTTLSRRQAEVYALHEQGATPSEMAAELDVSLGTVNSHRNRVREKYDQARNTVNELYRYCETTPTCDILEYLETGKKATPSDVTDS